jgi:hypothetical protein
LSREKKKHVKNIPYNLVIAFILLTAACLINYTLGAGLVFLLLYSLGVFFYIIYIKINSIGYRYNCDYIQSGEASVSLLAIIAVSILLSKSLYLLFPSVLLIVFLSDIFINRVLIKKGSEAFTAGIYINIFSVALLTFSVFKIPDFNSSFITQVLLGYITTLNPEPLSLLIPTALALFSALLYLILKPELVLFSHGPTYFRSTGMNYTGLRMIVTLFRSTVFTAAFFLSGIAGGAALYYHRPGRKGRNPSEFIMIALTYTQLIVMISLFYGKGPASAVSIGTSYIIYLILKRRRIYLYDRN